MELGNEYTGDIRCLKDIATHIKVENNWVSGRMRNEPKAHFDAKVFATGSGFGIKEGRVSKFSVYKRGRNGFVKEWYFNYDRGEDLQPTSPEIKEFVDTFVTLLGR